MSQAPLSRQVRITDPHGMHMRPADIFVRTARRFECSVHLIKDGNRVDGTSILEIMTLAVHQGSELTIETCGKDAAAALDALAELIERGFSDNKAAAEGGAG